MRIPCFRDRVPGPLAWPVLGAAFVLVCLAVPLCWTAEGSQPAGPARSVASANSPGVSTPGASTPGASTPGASVVSGTPVHAVAVVNPATLPAVARLDLAVLRSAYPGVVDGMERGTDGLLYLRLRDGTRLVYDDGKKRAPREAREHPDVRTMLAQIYPLGPLTPAMARPASDFNPGRRRVTALFKALYGNSQAEVRANCVKVNFDGHEELFNARHGAAAALARVAARIGALLPAHPGWARVLRPLGGTFCWREIAGTDRLSAHSFGAAIDLNAGLPYWRWERWPETVPAKRLAFPSEIVEAFEAEGFVWGGKWDAFDLMHFEYRPALILKARVLAGQVKLPR